MSSDKESIKRFHRFQSLLELAAHSGRLSMAACLTQRVCHVCGQQTAIGASSLCRSPLGVFHRKPTAARPHGPRPYIASGFQAGLPICPREAAGSPSSLCSKAVVLNRYKRIEMGLECLITRAVD
ncbi:hypothetical protein Ddc_13282 [Ditylenchus destructor]|nr:hypothetical protein Ddc_13282 [Ditylenchus destructor]